MVKTARTDSGLDPRIPGNAGQRGSAMVLAIFVMVVVITTGVSLLFLARNEQLMSLAYVRAKKVFYLAEGGEEQGRIAVLVPGSSLTDQLATVAGSNGVIDFDPDNLVPVFDSAGSLTGFSGYADDNPLVAPTALGDGWFASFLANDPDEGATSASDSNGLVIVTGVGVGRDRSTELAHAVLRLYDFPALPAAITLLGPLADFDGGTADAKLYTGDDGDIHCPGGDPLVSVPAVGVMGGASEANAEIGVSKPATFRQGMENGVDTVDDLGLLPGLDPVITDCSALVEFVQELADAADVLGDSSTPESELGAPGSPKLVFIDGDYVVSGSFLGAGLLVVTGHLTLEGGVGWQGVILVVGQGEIDRAGGGNGTVSGAIVVADVEGPDQTLFTADDCSGEDGILGNSDDGVAQSVFSSSGGGNGTFGFCSTYIDQMSSLMPLSVVSFRQG